MAEAHDNPDDGTEPRPPAPAHPTTGRLPESGADPLPESGAPSPTGPLAESGARPDSQSSTPPTPAATAPPADLPAETTDSPAPKPSSSSTPAAPPGPSVPASPSDLSHGATTDKSANDPTAGKDKEKTPEKPGQDKDATTGKTPGKDAAADKDKDKDAAAGKTPGKAAGNGKDKNKDAAAGKDQDAAAAAAAGKTTGEAAIDLDKPAPTAAGSARVTRVLRRASPVRAAKTTAAWAKRPTGRVILPAILGLILLAAAGTAGAYLVPKALKAGPAPSASPGFPLAAAPPGPAPSGGGDPITLPSDGATPGAPVGTGRPADALAGWAQQVGTRAGIPVVAVEAYGYAELVLAKTAPACHLSWTTIAAIGFVESDHGSFNNSVLNADGTVRPPIFGLPLDGKGGRQLIADTDKGAIDGDPQFDRAVGPLQFIPSTWVKYGIDADNNGVIDPNDIDDASLAAGNYLCAGGRDLSKADSWYEAILSYNAVGPYAAKVFQYANLYGQRSRV